MFAVRIGELENQGNTVVFYSSVRGDLDVTIGVRTGGSDKNPLGKTPPLVRYVGHPTSQSLFAEDPAVTVGEVIMYPVPCIAGNRFLPSKEDLVAEQFGRFVKTLVFGKTEKRWREFCNNENDYTDKYKNLQVSGARFK